MNGRESNRSVSAMGRKVRRQMGTESEGEGMLQTNAPCRTAIFQSPPVRSIRGTVCRPFPLAKVIIQQLLVERHHRFINQIFLKGGRTIDSNDDVSVRRYLSISLSPTSREEFSLRLTVVMLITKNTVVSIASVQHSSTLLEEKILSSALRRDAKEIVGGLYVDGNVDTLSITSGNVTQFRRPIVWMRRRRLPNWVTTMPKEAPRVCTTLRDKAKGLYFESAMYYYPPMRRLRNIVGIDWRSFITQKLKFNSHRVMSVRRDIQERMDRDYEAPNLLAAAYEEEKLITARQKMLQTSTADGKGDDSLYQFFVAGAVFQKMNCHMCQDENRWWDDHLFRCSGTMVSPFIHLRCHSRFQFGPRGELYTTTEDPTNIDWSPDVLSMIFHIWGACDKTMMQFTTELRCLAVKRDRDHIDSSAGEFWRTIEEKTAKREDRNNSRVIPHATSHSHHRRWNETDRHTSITSNEHQKHTTSACRFISASKPLIPQTKKREKDISSWRETQGSVFQRLSDPNFYTGTQKFKYEMRRKKEDEDEKTRREERDRRMRVECGRQ
ncbi:hypothetical protein PROFUN_06651 [Planoprotostelium fungivorum]|uniref:Uncharacterized protein n=1 Tax=Planoprotostelium fungivorum TaxID=1890364 RepID=A0A2P6MSW3_9EUKA|nr:hypothetical protein PROFUN_06651 [Planoprotostelium fungivorum]